MSKEFAARHIAGRRVVISFKGGQVMVGKALALINTKHGIAISVYRGRGQYPGRAYIDHIDAVYDANSGREIK